MLYVAALVSLAYATGFVEDVTAPPDYVAAFASWKVKHDKQYLTAEKAVEAFAAFVENHKTITAHNARSDTSWTMGLNQFSDLTTKQFRAHMLGYSAANATLELKMLEEHIVLADEVLPEAVDWSARAGCSTRVKNQGTGCGSCWAFSAVGAMEAQLCSQELSEEDLVACDKNDGACHGGSMGSAFRWVQSHGIASESAYPYTSASGRVGACNTAKEKKAVATVSGARSVTGESSLKSAVAGRAVSVAVCADCLQHYHGGILDEAGCSGGLDHGVLAVGYGTSGGTPYFKVKNSWGTGFGESGFFRVVYGKGMLGIGKQAVYPTGVRRE